MIYTTVMCDGCQRRLGHGIDGRAARKQAVKGRAMTFVQPGGRDYCQSCVEAGAHLTPARRPLFSKASA